MKEREDEGDKETRWGDENDAGRERRMGQYKDAKMREIKLKATEMKKIGERALQRR